jgi:hypothetical protein
VEWTRGQRKAISVRKSSGSGGLRGSRLGSGHSREIDRWTMEPRRRVSYWCEAGHESTPAFATSAPEPDHWPCHVCGNPAGRSADAPPVAPPRTLIPKTPYEYLKMRRSDEEGEAMLAEALAKLRKQGRTGS